MIESVLTHEICMASCLLRLHTVLLMHKELLWNQYATFFLFRRLWSWGQSSELVTSGSKSSDPKWSEGVSQHIIYSSVESEFKPAVSPLWPTIKFSLSPPSSRPLTVRMEMILKYLTMWPLLHECQWEKCHTEHCMHAKCACGLLLLTGPLCCSLAWKMHKIGAGQFVPTCVAFGFHKLFTLYHHALAEKGNRQLRLSCYCQHKRAQFSLSCGTFGSLGRAAASKKMGGAALNQFHSPVNYNPAFLISFPRTMLFIGVQAKHEASAFAAHENKPSFFAQSWAVKNMIKCIHSLCWAEEFRGWWTSVKQKALWPQNEGQAPT